MARKTLADFNYDYQAYADYLESPECANDEGYSTCADIHGNIYDSDDWTKGHGHHNVNSKWEGRDKDDPESKNHPWKNPWSKLVETLQLSPEEAQILASLYVNQKTADNNAILTEEPTKKIR